MNHFAAFLRTLIHPLVPALVAASLISAHAQILTPYDACADPNLSMQRNANGRYMVKWQAPAGATQLYWAPSLEQTANWQPVPGAIPLAGGFWQAEFLLNPQRAFFRVLPAAPPVPPPNVRLVMVGDHFRLEWDSTCDASGYAVYISTTPSPGPGNYLHRLPLPAANALEITGLTAGTRYYITIAATNLAGEGLTVPALSGFYGPKYIYSGRAIQSFTMPAGRPFEVQTEGAVITLTLAGQPGVTFSTTVNSRGEFHLPDLPSGSYIVSYLWNGVSGTFPSRVSLGLTDVQSTLLNFLAGTLPPSPATTLLGTVTLPGGLPARVSAPQFGLNAQATLTATFGDNSTRTVTPDAHGAFAFTGITGGFPVTLTAVYQGLTAVTSIAAPPVALSLHHLQFTVVLPELNRLTIQQNGHEVTRITPGVPVTFVPEVAVPDGALYAPKWIIEYNGQTYYNTTPSHVLTFGGPSGPVVGPEGGRVTVQFAPSPFTLEGSTNYQFYIDPPDALPPGQGCWSGVAGTWNPAAPNDILPASGAQVRIKHSASAVEETALATPNQNGVTWFEANVDPDRAAPYLLRILKADHMPFLWPFEFQLPKEATFCVVPATISTHAQISGDILQVTRAGSDVLIAIPYGSLKQADNTPWHGNIRVAMAVWNPLVRSPLPPGAELRGPGLRKGLHAISGVWFDITTDGGESLTPDANASLFFPASHASPNIPVAHQVESTGYFEQAGTAVRIDAARYAVELGRKGTFLLAFQSDLMEPVFVADRSLNYPFEVLVNKSIFPVTVTAAGTHNLGHFYMPRNVNGEFRVLDLLQSPGLHYVTPANASATRPLEPMKKTVIATADNLLLGPVATLPAITPVRIRLTLGDAEPSLKERSTDVIVSAINDKDSFLAQLTSTSADADAYYEKINAPSTLALWRALNGFPATFGGLLPGVGLDEYASCYYYNLGDLGFARAQTMRITTSPKDGQPDVAFAVTNYPTLEDARCRRSPIATVCMDYALRHDLGENTPSRYTRFYVYGSDGKLLNCADLDGAGTLAPNAAAAVKCVPNLCVICHGGKQYEAGETTNLGSRFLPFDVESYNFHPRYGVQKQELAAMNAAVLKTQTSGAIANLIEGWYGNANPLASPATFNQSYAPTAGNYSWAGQTTLYTDMFKHSCRVCHVSRDAGYRQVNSFISLQNIGFGHASVCGAGMSMPNSQRTWGIFWGSRTANKLGAIGVPDMPTLLGNAASNAAGSPLPCRP